MKPIVVQVKSQSPKSPKAIGETMMDVSRWPEFEGYSFLPGIESAAFETQTTNWVGTRIRVCNKDGSKHIEEIVEWIPDQRIVLRFQEFQSPLRRFASHFLETWEFSGEGAETTILRSMAMYPKGIFGWLILKPISGLMRKAFQRQAERGF
jgi:hypothetical protein